MTVTDTAYWTAACRAVESRRPDALFIDPCAAGVVGDRDIPVPEDIAWSVVVRTALLDDLVVQLVRKYGIHTVLNLGAGFDVRPYRIPLPSSLRWIDVDLEEIGLARSGMDILRCRRSICHVEWLSADLIDREQRLRILDCIGGSSDGPVLVVAEGLIAYLTSLQATGLASDMARILRSARWLVDLIEPGHLQSATNALGGMPLFGPLDGAGFFEGCGWRRIDYWSLQHAASRSSRKARLPALWGGDGMTQYRHATGVALLSSCVY